MSAVLYQFLVKPDRSWNFIYLSPGIEVVCEVTPEAGCANSQELLRLIVAEDRALHRASIERAMKTLQFWEHEYRIRPKSGVAKWIRTQAIPEQLPDGAVLWSGMLTDITERKRADLAMRESGNRYRTLLDNLPQIIWQKDMDSVYVSSNEAYARSLGITARDLPGKTDYDFYPRDLADKYRDDDLRIMESGLSETLDERWIIDGEERVIHTTKVPLRDGSGSVYGTLGIAEDVTERKSAEIALQESEEKYRLLTIEQQAILNTRLFGIAKFRKGTVTWANPGLERILGYGPGEAIGATARQHYRNEEDYRTVGAEVFKDFTSGGTSSREIVQVRRDGALIWVGITGAVLNKETGETLWAFVDVTERRTAEEVLLRSEESYRRQFTDNASVMLLFDPHSLRIIDANDSALSFYGYSREQMLAKHMWDISQLPAEELRNRAAKVGMERGLRFEYRQLLANGSVREVEASVSRIHLGDREILHSIVFDITDRKRANEQLVAAKKAAESANLGKTRFLAAASHDLWQPVHAINMFSEALCRTGLNEKQKQLVAKLSLASDSLGEILKALLEMSRLDSGVVTPNYERLSAEELFYWIDSVFSPLSLAKGLRFKLHFPTQDVALFTDTTLLRSLLSNVIANAVRYTQRGGVLVGIRRHGNRALIQVWDTGVGIPPEHLGEIFGEYYQVGNPERNSAKGLGLGLSIVKQVSHLLQTQVVVRSRLGKGSLFEFSLPLFSDAQAQRDSPRQ